ncbi:L,D-transpeptidase [Desulfuromonas versatilis]|uniref:L,D-transpeptidase n=1 Tax=Desulfuromonas versatilis TaxID=2802975 RepID=A0ABN6DWS2_9BACT|nr:L,D-transpeptidase family protein [Desulfuromonas versatilis]BCR04573.1 L,D-transpeptidase [Desulfuromonas versatilis]
MLRSYLRHALIFPLAIGLLWAGDVCAQDLDARIRHNLEKELGGASQIPVMALGDAALMLQAELGEFYAERSFQPVWVAEGREKQAAVALVDILRGAAGEGLCPEDYHLGYLEDLLRLFEDYRRYGLEPDPAWLAQFEILLSDGLFRYASHLIQGRVDPAEVHDAWRASPRKADLAKLLRYAVDSERLETVLADLVPPHPGYQRLKSALKGLRRISALGGWATIPAGPLLRPGGSDPRLPLLRQRLWAEGDLVPPIDWSGGKYGEEAGDYPRQVEGRAGLINPGSRLVDVASTRYDSATIAAMRRFQRRHGLSPDGVLGPKTLTELNVSVEERIRQVELNLERWRWLPKSLGSRYLMVNAADFRLRVVEQGSTVLTMPVVVGTGYRKTPVFSAHMTYLEFAPYWIVPPTILREDKLPLIRSNPDWLRRHNYEIVPWGAAAERTIDPGEINWRTVRADRFPGVLRMRPGPWNPLGRVKFMFPNRYAVYLHDTPDRHLFNRNVRSFSSGCIRIERPLDLAQYLLENDGWDCEALIAKMRGSRPSRVELQRPLPVHILYWTAWVDEAGVLNFREDLYHRDLDLELALFEGGTAAGPAGETLAERAGG